MKLLKLILIGVFMFLLVTPVMAKEYVGYVLESDVMDTPEGEMHLFKMDSDGVFFLNARGKEKSLDNLSKHQYGEDSSCRDLCVEATNRHNVTMIGCVDRKKNICVY